MNKHYDKGYFEMEFYDFATDKVKIPLEDMSKEHILEIQGMISGESGEDGPTASSKIQELLTEHYKEYLDEMNPYCDTIGDWGTFFVRSPRFVT